MLSKVNIVVAIKRNLCADANQLKAPVPRRAASVTEAFWRLLSHILDRNIFEQLNEANAKCQKRPKASQFP